METINATRMNLLLKKEETKDASTGAQLLRNKRDVLLNEFFSTLKPLLALREALDGFSQEASEALLFALGFEGKERLTSFSFIRRRRPSVEINYKNILGLKLPEISFSQADDGEGRNFVKETDTSMFITEAKDTFQNFLNLALRLLPQELKLKRLGQEIKNTTRKVNSLEKFVIPQLHNQVKFIQEALEEREREDIFRLKRLKGHREK